MTLALLTFFVSAVCALALLFLGLADWFRDDFTFWPPPEKGSWQDRTFIWLFRGMLYSLIILSIREFSLADRSTWSLICGVILLVAGFGTAIASTLNLGWKNAFGDKQGLVTNGWFAHSRNPVYLVSWIGMIGWAILVPGILVWIILRLWALMYLLAVCLEERWLERVYGEEFRAYKAKVGRFV